MSLKDRLKAKFEPKKSIMSWLAEQTQNQATEPTEHAQGNAFLAATALAMGPAEIVPQFAPQPPLILSGATPCPICQGTWEIETYGPDGNTRCYTCRTIRDGTQWVEPLVGDHGADPALAIDRDAEPLVDEARSMIKWVRPKPSASATATAPRSITAIRSLVDGI